jgi:uncharacterized membrane protein HdeD (DUF308 family)
VFDVLGKNWWAILIRGVAAIVFGILAFIWPGETLIILIALFGAYAFVDGIFSIVAAARAAEHHTHWVALLLEGILGIIIGVITFFHPALAAVALLYLIAAWAIVTGVLEIFAATRLRRELAGDLLLVLAGVASIVFGVLLAIFPGAGLITVVWLLGIYAIVFGVLLLALAFRLREWHQTGSGGKQPGAAEPA